MKPDWSSAPAWANFLAMDEDGYWMWYQDEPFWCGGEENEWLMSDGNEIVAVASKDGGDVHASQTLERRP